MSSINQRNIQTSMYRWQSVKIVVVSFYFYNKPKGVISV